MKTSTSVISKLFFRIRRFDTVGVLIYTRPLLRHMNPAGIYVNSTNDYYLEL
jgi:hypothetical protein